VELAIATQIAPSHWREETDEAIATALDVLERQAAQIKRRRR
jgi:hypothetical protein